MDEKMRILKMVEEGTVTAEEAWQLMDAMGINEHTQLQSVTVYEKKLFHIHVESADGDNVNIQLPVGAVRKIIKATGKLPIPDTQTTNVDFAELLDAVCDLLDAEVQGDLINIEAADGDNVRIYVE